MRATALIAPADGNDPFGRQILERLEAAISPEPERVMNIEPEAGWSKAGGGAGGAIVYGAGGGGNGPAGGSHMPMAKMRTT